MIVNFVLGSNNYTNANQIDTMPMTNDLFVEEPDSNSTINVQSHADNARLLWWLFALAIIAQLFSHY
jgi:hypothetical protein